jgi:NAD(P)-dependent dehydrogenase (short-subunit alcohol dehydrogenase family)
MANYLIIGASSGIGKALSEILLAEGHNVLAIGRNEAPGVTKFYAANVVTDTLPAIDEVLDGMIYCPGSITLKPFRGLKLEDIRRDMDINTIGAVRVLQQYLPNLQKAESPSVVLFSTVAVTTGMPYHASVAMAKGAIEGLTRSLAAEWAPKIRVNCVAPSLTDTPLAARLLDTDAKRASAAERHPLKRIGESKEVASIAHLLLQTHTRSVTGQVWHVDGGMSSVRA